MKLGGIDGINETHGIDGMETRKKCYLAYGNHGSDEADRINRTDYIDYISLRNCVTFVINQTDGVIEFSGIVTTDLTVLLEQLNYWNWTVITELLETMELVELIEPKQLLEVKETIG